MIDSGRIKMIWKIKQAMKFASLYLMLSMIGFGIPESLISGQRLASQSNTTTTIASDVELAAIAESGTGTPNDPYILRVSIFEYEEGKMEVSNTRAYFIITDSLIWDFGMSNYILTFRDVSHGTIQNTTIRGYDYSSDAGILIDNCTDVKIIKTHISQCDFGIELSQTKECLISNCTIYDNLVGIRFYSAEYTNVTWNTIVHNNDGIFASGTTNRIYGNKIGWNLPNGYDYGTNAWNDSMGIGNSWSDYNGTGVYEIRGQYDVLDHYPLLLQECDYSGPVIEHDLPYGGPIGEIFAVSIDRVKITANVTDQSGVDTVLLCSVIDGRIDYREMMNESAEGNGIYSYVFEGPFAGFTLRYFIWANDTTGFTEHNLFNGFYVQALITPIMLLIMITPPVLVGIIVIFYVKRWYHRRAS